MGLGQGGLAEDLSRHQAVQSPGTGPQCISHRFCHLIPRSQRHRCRADYRQPVSLLACIEYVFPARWQYSDGSWIQILNLTLSLPDQKIFSCILKTDSIHIKNLTGTFLNVYFRSSTRHVKQVATIRNDLEDKSSGRPPFSTTEE